MLTIIIPLVSGLLIGLCSCAFLAWRLPVPVRVDERDEHAERMLTLEVERLRLRDRIVVNERRLALVASRRVSDGSNVIPFNRKK